MFVLGRLGLPDRLPFSKPKVNWLLHIMWTGHGVIPFLHDFCAKIQLFLQICNFFCIFAKKYDIWLYPQAFEHSINTAFLLVKVGMDIEIEGCGDISMSKQDTDGFTIAARFDATRSKTMSQAMEFYERDV